MPVTLGLIPAASTAWQARELIEGNTPLPATEDGLRALTDLCDEMQPYNFKGIYCYSEEPAKSSSLALAKAMNLPVTEWPELQPVEMGNWTGLGFLEVEERFGRMYRRWRARPQTIAPPCGETLWEVGQRIQPVLEKIKSSQRSLLIIASREILISLQMLLEGAPSEESKGWPWSLLPPHLPWKAVSLTPKEAKG
ncbi:MAG: histidine phosphatase family protein [Planctomycetota bacterium]|jgi:broad specificity phosphatase PhoE